MPKRILFVSAEKLVPPERLMNGLMTAIYLIKEVQREKKDLRLNGVNTILEDLKKFVETESD